jgi:predicted AAA+ superfamily ATPase
MSARFVEAEFAADLSTVAHDQGADTYRAPREFFRITFMTGGLRKVLYSAIERLAGKGGDPVIGLQTSFGGGKTHTILALYHLASAKNPETLPGLDDIFKEAGIATLPMHSKPVVFVGTALGANQPIAIDGARMVKSLWGLIAVKLGGWKAYEKIKSSDEARTNPGSDDPDPQGGCTLPHSARRGGSLRAQSRRHSLRWLHLVLAVIDGSCEARARCSCGRFAPRERCRGRQSTRS